MIDTRSLAFPKPAHAAGKVTLSDKKRRSKLDSFFVQQSGRCCTCGCKMTREAGRPNTATLGHRNPEPMGSKKRDNDDNLLGAQCWKCNTERGSKRDE